MYKPDLTPEEKEWRIIERRKGLEEERKKRIFDPKVRTIGIDKNALEKQIQEKREREEKERLREEAFDSQRVLIDQQAIQLEKERQQMKKELTMLDNEFRKTYQTPENRKEWDLSDPSSLRKEVPLRNGDDDDRLGPASCQKFDGEDSDSKQRTRRQRQQMKEWTQAQIDERNARKLAEIDADMAYQAHVEEIDEKRRELEISQRAVKDEITRKIAEYNKALEQVKRDKERETAEKDTLDKLEEIRNNLDSDILTENPSVAESAVAPGRRVRKDHYKGMSAEQRQAFLEAQAKQRDELHMRKATEAEQEAWWQAEQERQRRAGLLVDRETQRLRKQQLKDLSESYKSQAVEKKEKYDYLYKTVYTTSPSDAYFAQFGRSTR